MAKQVLRKIILPGTSDKDIYGTESGYEGLEYVIYKPQPEHEIFNADLKPDNQIWYRPEFQDFSKLTKKECQDLYIREIRRIKHGVYVWIGGTLEYITGKHYFGLVHWKLKESSTDYLIYTETQRNIFYMFDLCEHDEKCAGAIIFSLKRLGKSELSQIEMFADAILTEYGRYIVQALNDDEAIDIFAKTHYANENLHQSLPIWNSKYVKSDPPSQNLVALRRDATKDSIVWKSADGFEGNNEVNFSVRPTKLSGIQGKKIKRAFLDEFASLKPIKEMTLGNYYSKAVAQVTEDFGAIVLGKLWLIATAENVESEALGDAEEIWNMSDETKKDANGFTPSRLKRMLIPYYLGGRSAEFMDKFGRPKIEEAKKFYENSLASKTEGGKTLFRRQNPENIGDVFVLSNKGGLEEDVIEILQEQKKLILNSDIDRKSVVFYERNNKLEYIIKSKTADKVILYEDPQPNVKYVVGMDGTGTDKQTTENKDVSDFAMVTIKAFESVNAINYTVVSHYRCRPEKIDDSYNVALFNCKYFNQYGGVRDGVLPETNQGGAAAINAHFTNRGEANLLKRSPNVLGADRGSKNKVGLYRDEYVKKMQIIFLNKFIRLHGHNISSIEIIDDCLNIGKKNTDLADAFMMAICALGNFETEKKKTVVHKPRTIAVIKEINGLLSRTMVVQNVSQPELYSMNPSLPGFPESK